MVPSTLFLASFAVLLCSVAVSRLLILLDKRFVKAHKSEHKTIETSDIIVIFLRVTSRAKS